MKTDSPNETPCRRAIPLRHSRWKLLSELHALREVPALGLNLPRLAFQPRGAGRPVLVVPGYGAGDASTAAIRSYLRLLNYRVHGWDLGINKGDVPALIPRVRAQAERLYETTGEPLRLVGWSLGGYLVREVARERPDIVDRVITLGTPVVGGPKYTAVAEFYRLQGHDLDAIELEVDRRERDPIPVPITAIYSRWDGVVAWQACIDHVSPNVEHVCVPTGHLAFGFSPRVYCLVAQKLAG